MATAIIATIALAAGILIGRYLRKTAPAARPIIPNVRGVFLVDPAGQCWRQ